VLSSQGEPVAGCQEPIALRSARRGNPIQDRLRRERSAQDARTSTLEACAPPRGRWHNAGIGTSFGRAISGLGHASFVYPGRCLELACAEPWARKAALRDFLL